MPADNAPPPISSPIEERWGGLIRRRRRWLPSRRGWLVLSGVAILAIGLAAREVYPFLAVNDPFPDGPLSMEGWMEGKAFAIADKEYRRRGCPFLFITGGPIEARSPLRDYHTYAELGAAALSRLGFPREAIQPVPARSVVRDRTYSSALALRHWMVEHDCVPAHLTVVSSGAHSRRTRLLFQKAFGDRTKIGMIALSDREFDPARWWDSNEGFCNVVSELIAYGYVRLCFWPRPSDSP